MPPRLSNTRVTHVGTGRGGKPKPVNPGNQKSPSFGAVKSQIARRQKISQDRADDIARGSAT
jgi:hypothetical protein